MHGVHPHLSSYPVSRCQSLSPILSFCFSPRTVAFHEIIRLGPSQTFPKSNSRRGIGDCSGRWHMPPPVAPRASELCDDHLAEFNLDGICRGDEAGCYKLAVPRSTTSTSSSSASYSASSSSNIYSRLELVHGRAFLQRLNFCTRDVGGESDEEIVKLACGGNYIYKPLVRVAPAKLRPHGGTHRLAIIRYSCDQVRQVFDDPVSRRTSERNPRDTYSRVGLHGSALARTQYRGGTVGSA